MLIQNLNITKKEIFSILIVCLITFSYISAYVLTKNIDGDAFFHTFYAKEIAETQNLITHQPHKILDIKEGNVIYSPISYPLLYHLWLSILYMVGGEMFLKLSSPFLASFTVCIVYLLFRNVNRSLGLFAGFFGVVLGSHRFIMAPMMEQYLIPIALLAMLFIYRLYRTGKVGDAILIGLFIGLGMVIKQQGLIIGFLLILFVFISYLLKKRFMFDALSVKHLLFIFFVVLLVAAVPLYNQIERTGTIGYSPDQTRLPDFVPFSSYINENILKSNFLLDDEGSEWMQNVIGYRLGDISVIDTYKQYILSPTHYNRWINYDGQLHIIIFSIFFFIGLIYLFRQDRIIFYLMSTIFLTSFLSTWLWNQRIHQYQPLGLVILSVFLVSGKIKVAEYLRKYNKLLVILFITYLIIILSISWVTYIHIPLFKQEGRQSNEYIEAFEELGKFVKENTPQEAIFLAAETNFRYYTERDAIWISEGGGGKIAKILNSTDPETAIEWINYYRIDYIFVNLDQTKRRGVYDYFPEKGLLSYIDNSSCFKKEFSTQNNKLILYKVTPKEKC